MIIMIMNGTYQIVNDYNNGHVFFFFTFAVICNHGNGLVTSSDLIHLDFVKVEVFADGFLMYSLFYM